MNRYLWPASILCVFITTISYSTQPLWDHNLDFLVIEERLQIEPVRENISIRNFLKNTGKVVKGDDAIKMITLESGLKAVFKPGEYRFAEIAAYKASNFLGLRLVPPTILRVIDGVEGSLQFFVESSIDLLKGNNRFTYFKKVSSKDISDMKIFYFVFGQWDLHAGNQIISHHGGHYYLALIDNAAMLHKQHIHYGDFAFIKKGENKHVPSLHSKSFPFDQVITIKPGPFARLKDLFGPYISKSHIEKIWSHHKPVTYILWNDAFWMQMYRYNPSVQPVKTNVYYASTLDRLQKLNREDLRAIWCDGMKTDTDYYEGLIDLIIGRRDELITHANAKGTIRP